MAAATRIDAEHFTNLFLLALWWQTRDSSRLQDRHTTVDAAARVFVGLGVLSAKLKTSLRKDSLLQSHFRRNIDECRLSDEDRTIAADWAATQRPMFVRHDAAKGEIDRERMLRDTRIYISEAGEKRAAMLEARYASLLTAERYLEKRAEMMAAFEAEVPEGARPFVAKVYRKRCEGDKD